MLFITITLLSSSLALNNSLTKDLEYLTPVDVVISKQMADYYELDQLPDKVREDLNYSTMETLTRAGINPDVQFKDLIEITIYGDESLTLRTSLGNTLSKFLKKYPYVMLDLKEQIVRLSDYNKIAALYGHQQLSLKNDEYIILADFKPLIPYRNETLKSGNTIEVNDNILKPAKEEIVEGFIHMAGNKVNRGIFIVPDKVVANTTSSNSILIANYKNNKAETEEFFNEYYTKNYFITTLAVVNTKIDIMASSIGLGAMVTFIGLYIGIIFMISSAAILSLKELSESTDNKERLKILRKIGADENMINKALFKQIGIFFICPLLIAIIHSIFGITFAINILETFGNDGLFESIIMTALLLIFIYGGYFIITYFSSKSMMRD